MNVKYLDDKETELFKCITSRKKFLNFLVSKIFNPLIDINPSLFSAEINICCGCSEMFLQGTLVFRRQLIFIGNINLVSCFKSIVFITLCGRKIGFNKLLGLSSIKYPRQRLAILIYMETLSIDCKSTGFMSDKINE